jgi:hypothetical protein
MRRSRSVVRSTAFVLAAVLAGCGAADTDRSTDTDRPTDTTRPTDTVELVDIAETATTVGTRPSDIEFFADYPRYLWHTRRLSIATTNLRSEPIEVTSIALRADHFEPLAAEAKTTTIPAGARVDVQVDFGELVDCEPVSPLTAHVAMDIGLGAGAPDPFLIEIDPAPLDEIRDRECAQRRVDENVTVAFSDDRTVAGSTMATSIEIDRNRGTEPVRIDSVKGSVIIAMRPDLDTDPLAILDADSRHASIPLELFVTRCEPHAVSQSTLTFVLNAFITVGDAPDPHKFALPIDPQLRAELQGMIDHCSAQLAADGS